MTNRGRSIHAVGRVTTRNAPRLFLLALLAALLFSPAHAQTKPFDAWAPTSAAEAKEIEDFLRAYLNDSAAPDLAAIDALAGKLAGPAPACRNAVCVQTDCVVTHDSHQKAFLLVGELSAMQEALYRAYKLLLEHYTQLVRESDRKYDYKADVIDVTLQQTTLLQEGGRYLLMAADIASFIGNWSENIDKLKAGDSAVNSKIERLATVIDGLLEVLNQAGNLLELEEAVRVKMVALGMPVPSSMSNTATVISFINDAKSALQALKAAISTWGDQASRLAGLRKAAASIGQIIGKVLLIFSQREIDDMKRLVEGNDALMENYLTILAAEGAFNNEVLKELQRLKKLIDPMGATITRLRDAATAASECLKSCSPGQPLRNPPVNFQGYREAIPYYAARVKVLTRQLATGLSVYAATPIDPTDPNAPEMCRQVASPTTTDPLAGLKRPPLDFPKLPAVPSRYCSDQEKSDFNHNVLSPAQDRARVVWKAIADYDSALGDRIRDVNNALTKANADTSPNAPEVVALKAQLTKLQQERDAFDADYQKGYDTFSSFVSAGAAHTNAPIVDCEQPPPFQVTIPEVPDSFCSEEERREMIAQLTALFDEVKKQGQAWRDYRLELYTRTNNTGNATLKASLNQKIADSHEISDRIAQMTSELDRLLDKADSAPAGECIDPCLVGDWEATALTELPPDVPNGGAGIRLTFDKNGTETIDYSKAAPFVFSGGGGSWTHSGIGKARIKTHDNVAKIVSEEPGSVAQQVLWASGELMAELPWRTGVGPAGLGYVVDDNSYACTEESLSYRGSFAPERTASFLITFKRN